jgi:hypothetical protein
MRWKLVTTTVLMAAVGLACGAPTGDSGAQCGAPNAGTFDITVTRVLAAPYDFDAEAWDWDGDIDSWWEDYGIWVELLLLVATEGAYEFGTYDELIVEMDPYTESIFSQWVAPDLLVDVYWLDSNVSEWEEVGGFYDLAEDQHEATGLGLGQWSMGPESRVHVALFDEDIAFDDYIGELGFDLNGLRGIADCGPVGFVLTAQDMDDYETRINAIEVEVVATD